MAATEAEANKRTDPDVESQEGIEDDEHDSKDRVLQRYFLQEWTLLNSLLNDIVSSQTTDNIDRLYLSSAHKIRSIVDKYQEQGQLLEPYLDTIVAPLMAIIRSKTVDLISSDENALRAIKCVAIVVYALVTVCGYKSVTRFFPHHVSDLELAVSLMERCHVDGSSTTSLRQESTGEMEAKCVVLLWLSILVLVPFDISTVDSSVSDSDDVAPLVRKILEFSKDYLSSAGPMRSIAGLVLSRLLTRPDMGFPFSSFVEWTTQVLTLGSEDVASHFRLLGVVEALASLFKVGGRKMLIDVVPAISRDALELFKSTDASRSPLLRKYLVKLIQRIGLVCLPHRTPTWRYVGRTRSLGENVCSYAQERAADCSHGSNANSIKAEDSEIHLEDEDMDVPEIVEEIIEMLLCGLRDTDTVVRWSAAKGIGRLASRLTSSLSEEVLTSVLELFSPGEGDGSWHGACLALAELARRGLLLPISLPKVLPFIEKALHYDVRRGPHSVGSHVRDAAAYVCWAFGRAYYHSDMRNVLDELAPHLLRVACYDREVNCRRAAAAAFQENVGRQGSYPHGIDIVNTADYFALASRVNSYIKVAVSVAQYEGYLYPFAEELLHNKICHWDKGLRELSALAISALVKYDPDYFANFVLVKLIPSTLSSDLCTRHGATLAAGEVVLALRQCDYYLSTDIQKNVAGVVPAIEKARLYRGKGGEIMRAAVSRFIECVSLSHLALPERNKRSLLDSLNENLRHPNFHIQNAAVKALKHFIHKYIIPTCSGGGHGLTSKYLEQLSDQNVAVRRGSALALGVLPSVLLADQWKDVLLKLCNSCAIEHNPEDRDAEARVNAIKGVILVCETLHQARGYSGIINESSDLSLYHVIKNDVMTALIKALDDYSVDNRGDVGSWVREAAMEGLGTCTHLLCTMDSIRSQFVKSVPDMPGSVVAENNQTCLLFDANLATNVIGGIVKQAVEKMDKLREFAAKILQRILYNDTVFVPLIPHREKLLEIVPNELNLKWAVPSFSYPRFVQLLQFSCYSKAVLSGLVISIGGLQDSLRLASISALLDYLQADETGDFTWRMSRELVLSGDVLWVLQQYKKNDRVIIPTLKTIEILFSRKIFLNMEAHTSSFCAGVVDALAVELKGSKDFSKLYSGIAILGYIAPILDPISYRAFSHLLTMLSHRYPKIRKAAAEQVYLVLLQNGNLLPVNGMEKALEIISETCWDGDLEVAKHQKLELCEMAGLGVGQFHTACDKLPSNNGTKLTEIDENASYSSLVGSTGF